MWQVIAILLLAALLMAAFKIAIILLVVAGLIFKTKETVGLLAIGGVMNLFMLHPLAGVIGTAALLSLGAYLKRKEKRKQPEKPITIERLPLSRKSQ